jgi:hypothetical protein
MLCCAMLCCAVLCGAVQEAGDVVYEQGDAADDVLVLLKGRASLMVSRKGKSIIVRQLTAGSVSGGMSCFVGIPHRGTVRARRPCVFTPKKACGRSPPPTLPTCNCLPPRCSCVADCNHVGRVAPCCAPPDVVLLPLLCFLLNLPLLCFLLGSAWLAPALPPLTLAPVNVRRSCRVRCVSSVHVHPVD